MIVIFVGKYAEVSADLCLLIDNFQTRITSAPWGHQLFPQLPIFELLYDYWPYLSVNDTFIYKTMSFWFSVSLTGLYLEEILRFDMALNF